jgi:uncharacterized protein involved in propanediol utilization
MKSGSARVYARPSMSRRPAYCDRRTGFGVAPCHHGEWLQGQFLDGLRSVPGLVTVPCPLFRSRATFAISPDSALLSVHPKTHAKALRAARLALQWLGQPQVGGKLSIKNRAPARFGFGSSTADCLSAIRAVASALGRVLPAADQARLAIAAEGASDSTMFDASRPVLFLQCHGRILETFHPGWPEMVLLGFCTSADAKGVDTASIRRPAYSMAECREFARLRADLRRAIENRSVELLAQVGMRSAEINHRYFPVPHFSELKALAQRVGAAGLQIAHTGCLAGIIFPGDGDSERSITQAQNGLAAVGIAKTWRFRLGKSGRTTKRL